MDLNILMLMWGLVMRNSTCIIFSNSIMKKKELKVEGKLINADIAKRLIGVCSDASMQSSSSDTETL